MKSKISEVISENLESIMKSKKTGIMKYIKKSDKYTNEKKITTEINKEINKKLNEIKKMPYKQAKFYETNGITVILELEYPIENEDIEKNLVEHYENEGCFFQYAEGKELYYVCVGTKIKTKFID